MSENILMIYSLEDFKVNSRGSSAKVRTAWLDKLHLPDIIVSQFESILPARRERAYLGTVT